VLRLQDRPEAQAAIIDAGSDFIAVMETRE
jgi:hypothetical protein